MRAGLLLLAVLTSAGAAPKVVPAQILPVHGDRPAARPPCDLASSGGGQRGGQRGHGPRKARPLPPLPKPEAVAENQALAWGPVTQAWGPVELWGVPDGTDGLVVCDALSRPLRLERLALTGRLQAPTGQPIKVSGTLSRDANGAGALASARVVARSRASLAVPIPRLRDVAAAIARVDLGPLSYPTYAQATSEQCLSPQWAPDVTQALLGSPARQMAVSPDGHYLVAVLRGPRLAPGKGIVFRYLRACVVFDLRRWSVSHLLVDVEGWVEE